MQSPDADRIIGQLQGSLEGLQATMNRVLDSQENGRREVAEQIHSHAVEDKANFGIVIDRVGTLHDRIARLEVMADTVESHGDAILTLEQKQSDTEKLTAIKAAQEKAQHENNLWWGRGIIGAATAVGAASATAGTAFGPKIWKAFVAMMFGGGH